MQFLPRQTPMSQPFSSQSAPLMALRSLLLTGLLAGSSLWLTAQAASPPAGSIIENQATGSFVNPLNSSEIQIQSNTVKVTVAEVAGITVTAGGVADDGQANPGDTVYFSFVLTNVGNDETLFFLPEAPASITGGTLAGDIQIVQYDPDGTGTSVVDLSADNITVPSGGTTTDTLLGSNAAVNNGVIPAGAELTIRVPVTLNSSLNDGDSVTVAMGDTPADTNGSTQNQPDSDDGTNANEVRTVDPTATGTDDPINGEREASTSQTITAIASANSADYGDAPASYRDASHNLMTSPSLYLGSVAPDGEAVSQLTSSPSTGDDDDGNDDEDAFVALPNVPFVDPNLTSLSIGRNYKLTVPVTNTTGGSATLHAWIDFDQDGKFEAAEYQSSVVSNNATSVGLDWTVPLTAILGDTHARFRITSDTLTDNTGLLDPLNLGIDERAFDNASDGEVEDYPVAIAVPLYDYGDAPDANSGTQPGDYQTTESDGGPSHVVVDTIGLNLSLGSHVDGDDGSLQNSNADADDLDGTSVDVLNTLVSSGNTGLDDEDGVDISSLPALTATPSQTYTVPVTVRNNIPLLNAYLVGYIDFNQDGDFDDAGERSATVTVPPLRSLSNPASELRTVNVTFTTPAGIVPGDTYARFRLGSIQEIVESATGATASTNTGEVNNGEVEDYKITVAAGTNSGNTEPADYGDAPSSYGDASHDLAGAPGLYLGITAPDGEASTQLTSAASAGDDDDGNDDEDAFFVLPNVPLVDPSLTSISLGRNYSLTVPVTNTTGSAATLHAWIDFNQNGKFEADEHQAATVNPGQDSVNLTWDMDSIINFLNLLNLPLSTFLGDTHARFRLTSDTLTDKTGALDVLNLGIDERALGNASDGEVEDYPVSVAVPLYDYGDAPDTGTGTSTGNYRTTESDDGPTHIVIQDPLGLLHLSLGTHIDGDDGSLQDVSASADDAETTDVDILGTLLSGGPTGLDDEDGVSSFPALTATPGQTYTVSVTVRNNIPLLNAYLVGYIDFNQDGDFDDPGERSATVTVPSDLITLTSSSLTLDTTGAPRTFDVTFTIPADVVPGDTYARFRLGSIQEIVESATGVTVSTSNGDVNNGEVEDYPIAIAASYELSPSAGQIIINEVLYNETGVSAATNDEFIELYNASNAIVDLSNWQLIDGNSAANDTDGTGSITGSSVDPAYVFPAGTTLAAGEYAIVWIGDNTAAHQAPDAAFQTWLGQPAKLNNTGDDVWLYDDQTRIVDYIAYGSGSAVNQPPPAALNLWADTYQGDLAGAADGQSISLTPNGQDGNASTCWELTTSSEASGRCSSFLPTRDTDPATSRTASVGVSNNGTPNVVLVKRITAINGSAVTLSGDALDDYINDSGDANDDASNPWPTPVENYLVGGIDGGLVVPGDEIEYTIYFLSNGGADAQNVLLCDYVPANTAFVASAFNSSPAQDPGGLSTGDRGIVLSQGTTTASITNLSDGDRGYYFSPGIDPAGTFPGLDCDGDGNSSNTNLNGAVVVELGTLPYAESGTPTPAPSSYGFVRFRGRVK